MKTTGQITLSCGHEVEEMKEAFSVALADYDADKRAVVHSQICALCFEAYERTGIILKTEQEKQDYLNGK